MVTAAHSLGMSKIEAQKQLIQMWDLPVMPMQADVWMDSEPAKEQHERS